MIMKKWEIEIKGKDEKVAVKYIKAMLAAFEMAVKIDQPLDHADFSERGASLNCHKVKG